jgi:transposase InsO family protein
VSISVTNNPTAEWIAGQVTDAFPWHEAPRHLIRDHDGAFGPAYTRRIRAMGIRDHPTARRSPWQNGHVERLIGSIRRESLDHLIVFGEAHLRGVLKVYASYYNEVRTHLSLDQDAPDFRRAQKFGRIAAIPMMAKYVFLVMTNPTSPEQKAEYNRWYATDHYRDVLGVPGFVAAQLPCGSVMGHQAPGPHL